MNFHDIAPLAFWLCYLVLVVIGAIWIYRAAIR